MAGGQVADEAIYQASPEAVWDALVAAIGADYRLAVTASDARIRRVEFKSGISLASSGQRFSGTVVPSGDGSALKLTSVAKQSGIANSSDSRGMRIIGDLIRSVAGAVADSAPRHVAAAWPPPSEVGGHSAISDSELRALQVKLQSLVSRGELSRREGEQLAHLLRAPQ